MGCKTLCLGLLCLRDLRIRPDLSCPAQILHHPYKRRHTDGSTRLRQSATLTRVRATQLGKGLGWFCCHLAPADADD